MTIKTVYICKKCGGKMVVVTLLSDPPKYQYTCQKCLRVVVEDAPIEIREIKK